MVRTYLLEGFTRHWKTFFVADHDWDVNLSASLRFKADRATLLSILLEMPEFR